MNILDLPECMLEQIFECLSYDEIAKKRLICKQIDVICQCLLNRGFHKMVKRHSTNMKRIKSLLPRRESERRNHPLARHADILTCIETRISMLSMTYTKYMELNLCCFIPGKVIDEILRILYLIETTNKPLRAHEVLQELRDISSMAIEHFDEKIAHLLKKTFMDTNSLKCPPGSTPRIMSCDQRHPNSRYVLTLGAGPESLIPVENTNDTISPDHCCAQATVNRAAIQKLTEKYRASMIRISSMIHIQGCQKRRLRENAALISEMNTQIIELKKRIEEVDAKNREISANITQITGEPCAASTNDRPTRNIKPRTATLILKRRIDESVIDLTDQEELSKKQKME